jgi:hypothetical protein
MYLAILKLAIGVSDLHLDVFVDCTRKPMDTLYKILM